MTHFADDDLVLFYYGEHPHPVDVERHLQECLDCGRLSETISRTLTRIALPPPPELDADLSARILTQVRNRIVRSERRPLATAATAAAVWLVPLLYPLSFRVVVNGFPLAAVLLWTLSGPGIAVLVLNAIRDRGDDVRRRFVALGALLATVSPALFILTARSGLGLPLWYATTALGAIAAFLPLPELAESARLCRIHRFSGVAIALFAAGHIVNQAAAIVSVPAHAAVADVLRSVYRQPLVEMSLLAAIALQVMTGVTMWRTHVRRATFAGSVQAVSGFYLAAFFLGHVAAVVLARYHQLETDFVWAAGRRGLLASQGSMPLLPYYLLGIMALFVHAGVYARVAALRFMPESIVRRLSYAALAFGGVTVVTVALALCGIHLIPS